MIKIKLHLIEPITAECTQVSDYLHLFPCHYTNTLILPLLFSTDMWTLLLKPKKCRVIDWMKEETQRVYLWKFSIMWPTHSGRSFWLMTNSEEKKVLCDLHFPRFLYFSGISVFHISGGKQYGFPRKKLKLLSTIFLFFSQMRTLSSFVTLVLAIKD